MVENGDQAEAGAGDSDSRRLQEAGSSDLEANELGEEQEN